MAKSEHQGLQIGMISFAMIAVVLAILTFMYYGDAQTAYKSEADHKKKADAATTRANTAESKIEYVLHILGIAPLPEAQVATLETSFGADETMKNVMTKNREFLQTYAGGGIPKESQNYAGIAPTLLTSIRDINNSLLQQTAESSKLAKEQTDTRKSEQDRTQKAIDSQKKAEDALSSELTKYSGDRTDLEKKQTDQFAMLNARVKEKEDAVAAKQKEVEDKQKDITKLNNVVDSQKTTIIAMRDEPFEVADGQVTWVNQGANTVWVNLGLADGLRRQTLFSVYDQADNGVTRSKKKASIEVTRVLDQHLCEARIVEDGAGNPILPGDQVFSPAWRPGKRVRFALAGFIDIDGDRRSDRTLVRSLLSSSGGTIDAELHDDGTLEGKIDSGTRYLVLGDKPNERSDPKVLAAYSKLHGEAVSLGIEIIPVEKMLDWVGYRPEIRSVGLGKNADPNQFKPQPPEGKAPTSTGTVSDKFKERNPGDNKKKSGAGSAFK